VGEILVGTSGYSYDDWVGPVYPAGTDRGDFLALYAERFPFTELNFTYYRLPTAHGLRQIAAKVPPGFRFVVKAFGSITHRRGEDWGRDAEAFVEALQALGQQRSGVLLQFPYSFHYTRENRRHLASVADALSAERLFVEFRNDEWEHGAVWEEMERRNLGLVIPDLPRLNRLPRGALEGTFRTTAPHAYVRFHGRNSANWWQGTNVTRYDYRYSTEELAGFIEPVRELAARSEVVLVAFNNHFAGQAVANAEEFMRMLGLAA
jgi:uncharacterized protein YecE (DUF72 family)